MFVGAWQTFHHHSIKTFEITSVVVFFQIVGVCKLGCEFDHCLYYGLIIYDMSLVIMHPNQDIFQEIDVKKFSEIARRILLSNKI